MRVLITGGAGFIGANAARSFLADGHDVVVFDSFARPGAEANASWLGGQRGRIELVRGDVREPKQVEAAVAGADVVLHLAAQVAVTTSVENPRLDFEVNALGTFNVLEAVRLRAPAAVLLSASTN